MQQKKKHDIKWFFAYGKPWYVKWWLWVLVVIIFDSLVAVPITINYAYMEGLKLRSPNTAFSASDLLSLYATLLGALATISVLIITLSSNRKAFQNCLKEQRIRTKFEEDKRKVVNILDIILLKKYDTLFTDNKSLILFMQDLNEVYFETLAKVPLSEKDQSNTANFYRKIYLMHGLYKNEIEKVPSVVPRNLEEGEKSQCNFDACKKAIVHIKNEYLTDIWFLQKGIEFDLIKNMNTQIDKIYGLKE